LDLKALKISIGGTKMTSLLVKLFIKNKDDMESPLVRVKIGTFGGLVGIFCNILLFTLKFTAGTMAGAVSLVVDAFNNLSDIGSSVITLLGFKIANKPADKEHPFGHGRMEYMSAAGVSIIIILVGVELFKTSLDKVLRPQNLSISFLTFIVLIISICVKLWMAFFNRKLGRIINSSALRATALDSLSDCIATSAVLISVIIAKIFEINIDPFVGLAVSAFIIYSGIRAAKETLDPLLGVPPEDNVIDEIEEYVLSFDEFVGVHDLIVHNYGPGRSFATLHVEVPCDINIVRCHEQIDLCERNIYEKFRIETVIHMDPIVTNDEYINDVKHRLKEKIAKFDSELDIHDFRVVKGELRTNLIFDVVIPQKYHLSHDELKNEIAKMARQIDETFCCVITVDLDYIHHTKP